MALVQKAVKANRKTTILYSDLDINVEKSPGNKDLVTYANEESVKNSIRNIVLTNKSERFFNTQFGCDVKSMMFENVGPSTEAAIQNFIVTAIENYEPRAQLIDVTVSANPDENSYAVTIIFNTINTTTPETLDIILTRVR